MSNHQSLHQYSLHLIQDKIFIKYSNEYLLPRLIVNIGLFNTLHALLIPAIIPCPAASSYPVVLYFKKEEIISTKKLISCTH